VLKSLIAAAALAATVPLAPALADNGGPTLRIEIGHHSANHRPARRGYAHHSQRDYAHRPRISRHEAVRIARHYGLSRVTDVDFDRGRWEVEGRTRRGARVEVEISARTGRVVDVDYFRRGRGYNRHGRAHRRAHEDRGVTWTMTDYERSWDGQGDVDHDRRDGRSDGRRNRHGRYGG